MNATRVKEAITRIERNEWALKWLKEHGRHLVGPDKDAFSLTFTTNFASACMGAKEAKEAIDAIARFEIETIVQAAIRNCENTIVLDRDAIREELASSAPSPTQEG